MNMLRKWVEVRAARQRVERARQHLAVSSGPLLTRVSARPLACVGAAAASGVLMGRLGVRPWRAPGVLVVLSHQASQLATRALSILYEFKQPS